MMGKIQNLFLLIRVLVHVLFHGRSDIIPESPKRILVVQGAKLGDMVCTTPLFRAIKKNFPSAKLLVAGDRVNKKLLEHNSDVDEYIILEKGTYVSQFKEACADVALLTGPSPDILGSLMLAIPSVIAPYITGGYCPHETRAYKLMSFFVKKVEHEMGHYAPREYLVLLRAFGIEENDTTKHLAYSSEAGERAQSLLGDFKGLLVGVAPGTGHDIKLWSTEKFSTVVRELVTEYGAHVFLIGSGSDHIQIDKVLAGVSELGNVHNMCDRFSVDALKAFISKLDLFISVDTGPVYIAEAFGVKTIDIVGPMDEKEQPPRGEKHIALVAERKAPAIHIMNTRVYDYAEARRQSDAITVEDVLHAVKTLMPERVRGK